MYINDGRLSAVLNCERRHQVAYKKGEPVYKDKAKTVKETGIWKLADNKGYLVEVNFIV